MRRFLLIAAALLAPGLGHAAEMTMSHHHVRAAGPATAAYAAAMTKMMSGATPTTGDPDKDFVAMMIPHHQAAIDMAQAALNYAKDPVVLKLARAIMDAQAKEVAEMRAWQAAHEK